MQRGLMHQAGRGLSQAAWELLGAICELCKLARGDAILLDSMLSNERQPACWA